MYVCPSLCLCTSGVDCPVENRSVFERLSPPKPVQFEKGFIREEGILGASNSEHTFYGPFERHLLVRDGSDGGYFCQCNLVPQHFSLSLEPVDVVQCG